MKPVEEVILHFGNKSRLAEALGIRPPAVSRWKEFVPPCRAYQIEILTNGKFKAENLTNQKKGK